MLYEHRNPSPRSAITTPPSRGTFCSTPLTLPPPTNPGTFCCYSVPEGESNRNVARKLNTHHGGLDSSLELSTKRLHFGSGSGLSVVLVLLVFHFIHAVVALDVHNAGDKPRHRSQQPPRTPTWPRRPRFIDLDRSSNLNGGELRKL